jgi:hypothetical protein
LYAQVPEHVGPLGPPERRLQYSGTSVVVVVSIVVVVTGATGAQSIVGFRGVTVRVPNWSMTGSSDGTPIGHFTL